MDQLRQQVARARRRLVLEQFLGRLVWCLLGALTLAAIAIAVPRIIAIENLPANWDMTWLLGALGVGFLSPASWTFITSRSPLDAAIEIDRRFDLRERIASSLSLPTEEQSSEAGRAVVNDALRRQAHRRRRQVPRASSTAAPGGRWCRPRSCSCSSRSSTIARRQSSLDPTSPRNVNKQVKKSARIAPQEDRRAAARRPRRQDLKAANGLFKQIEQGTQRARRKEETSTAPRRP